MHCRSIAMHWGGRSYRPFPRDSLEINDFASCPLHGQTGEQFAQTIRDQFDGLCEDGAKTGRVMALALHPFPIGHPHCARHLAKALAHIRSRSEVWIATGGEIADRISAKPGSDTAPASATNLRAILRAILGAIGGGDFLPIVCLCRT